MVVPLTRYTNYTFMAMEKKQTVGLLHKRFGIASEVFGITTCLGRLCSCHFSPRGKGGDAMELPCVTHRAEPTAPNGGTAREKPHSQNLQGKILLRADFPSYPVHCTLIWQLLTPVGVTAAPQKPPWSSSPAAWDMRHKGSTGKVLAHGHIPSMLSTCQEQDRGQESSGRQECG